MKRKIIFLVVLFAVNIEFALADWPNYIQCPNINSIVKSTGGNYSIYRGFILYSSRKNEPSLAEKFVGADLNSSYTFSCYYELDDGTGVTAKFDLSKCSAHHGFDSSGKCNNSDPDQCMVVCSY